MLRGRWCGIILNVHEPTQDKIYDTKDSFYKELERGLYQLRKYHVKILVGDFNANVVREDLCIPTIKNEILHDICNDDKDRVVNFATSKNLIARIQCFHVAKFIKTIFLPMAKHTIKFITS
jgi:exonuclease III